MERPSWLPLRSIGIGYRRQGRHYDAVRITVKSSTGAVVAHVDGTLSGGNIQFVRVH